MSFKSFYQPKFLTESGYGIPHLEELPIEQFVRMLKKLGSLRAVQKLDGANLIFGIDREGEPYTSREQKGGKRFYKENDFPKRSAYDGFKSASLALYKVADSLKKVIKPGQALSVEVLFGPQPNTVIYGKDSISWVAFLEPSIGDDPTLDRDFSLPLKLKKALKDERITVSSTVSDTTDGEFFVKQPQTNTWGFTCSDYVPKEDLEQAVEDVSEDVAALNKFLEGDNVAAEKLGLDLTNYEVLKHKSPKLADERERLEALILDDFKMPIKDKLLSVSKKQKPSLRGPEAKTAEGYNGIEGLIFADDESSEQFKVVDKDEFLAVNKFNYQVRNRIFGKIMTVKDDASMEARGGIIGIAKIRCIRLFGIPGVDLRNQAKKGLVVFKGDDKGETVRNIGSAVKRLSYESVKRKMGAIITSSLGDLEDELQDFKENTDKLELELKNGKKIKYTKEVRRRTLMTFAEGRRTLDELLKHIRKADRVEDLIVVFFKRAIDEIHAEPESGMKKEKKKDESKAKDELKKKPSEEETVNPEDKSKKKIKVEPKAKEPEAEPEEKPVEKDVEKNDRHP